MNDNPKGEAMTEQSSDDTYRAMAFGGPEWKGVADARWESDCVAVRLGRVWDDRIEHVVDINTQTGVMVRRTDPDQFGFPPDSTLMIPTALAKTLLDLLSQHFGGTGDTRSLRKDYDAERARVDRLIGAVIEPLPTPGVRVVDRSRP